MKEELKKKYEHLPHVKSVWVKGEHVYLSKVHGAKEVSLEEDKDEKTKVKKIKNNS